MLRVVDHLLPIATNLRAQGTLLFVDGHVEYAPRDLAHAKSHVLPDEAMYPGEPEIGP